jgi:hypothetical protein
LSLKPAAPQVQRSRLKKFRQRFPRDRVGQRRLAVEQKQLLLLNREDWYRGLSPA